MPGIKEQKSRSVLTPVVEGGRRRADVSFPFFPFPLSPRPSRTPFSDSTLRLAFRNLKSKCLGRPWRDNEDFDQGWAMRSPLSCSLLRKCGTFEFCSILPDTSFRRTGSAHNLYNCRNCRVRFSPHLRTLEWRNMYHISSHLRISFSHAKKRCSSLIHLLTLIPVSASKTIPVVHVVHGRCTA